MLWQQAPAQTFSFMVFGYAVILGVIGIHVASLVVRFRQRRVDLDVLRSIEEEEEPSGD
jgi:hypothetical protein